MVQWAAAFVWINKSMSLILHDNGQTTSICDCTTDILFSFGSNDNNKYL